MQLFLVQAEPLQTKSDVISVSQLQALRTARHDYTTLLLEKMRAPDGSYEDGLTIPGTNEPPSRVAQSRLDLSKNNPLSLDDQACGGSLCSVSRTNYRLESVDGVVRIDGAEEGNFEGR